MIGWQEIIILVVLGIPVAVVCIIVLALKSKKNSSAGFSVDPKSVEGRLAKLKALYDNGHITYEQYERRQEDILNEV